MGVATMSVAMIESDSWLGLDDLFDSLVENTSKGSLSGTSSETSSTSESSDGYVIDDNYMIIARTNSFDDMSEMVDSVATERTNSTSVSGKIISQKQHRRRRMGSGAASSPSSLERHRLQAVAEEEEDAGQYEAYLRAKMFSLWGKIQDHADVEEHSETPTTETDAKLLKEFAENTRS